MPKRASSRLLVPIMLSLLAVSSISPALAYPPAGFDSFSSSATIIIELTPIGGPGPFPFVASGPTTIQRGDPLVDLDGRGYIDTEIISMTLTGPSPLGPIIVRESPTLASSGRIKQQTPGVDFPADSFFDVFVEIDIPPGLPGLPAGGTCGNLPGSPAVMSAVINAIPPVGSSYGSPVGLVVPLFGIPPTAPIQCGRIMHVSHTVGEPIPVPKVPELILPAILASSLSLVALSAFKRVRK